MAKAINYFHGTVERETARAILVRFISGVYISNLECTEATVWLPKSQVEVYHHFDGDGSTIWKVPTWLVRKNDLQPITKKTADEVIRHAA